MDLAQSELGLGPHVAHGPQGGDQAAEEHESQGVGEREGTERVLRPLNPLSVARRARSHNQLIDHS